MSREELQEKLNFKNREHFRKAYLNVSIDDGLIENEKPLFDTNLLSKLKSEKIQIDTVITHSAPSFCMPLLKTGIENWLLEDEHLETDMAEERRVMDALCNWLLSEKHPVQNWFYGHFHDSHVEYISDIRFQMLNIMELYELNTNT